MQRQGSSVEWNTNERS